MAIPAPRDDADAREVPILSDAGLEPSHAVVAVDESGESREGHMAGEQPPTLYSTSARSSS